MASQHPPSDDVDRDKLYSVGADDEDGDEYELEPPDADVLAGEERRAQEAIAAVMQSVELDELERDDEQRLDIEIIDQWMRNLRFQFQVKHLLVATAVVAILVALGRANPGSTVLLLVMVTVGGVLTYLAWKQREHEAAVEERRRQLYAQRRAELVRQRSPGSAAPAAPSDMYAAKEGESGSLEDLAPVEKRRSFAKQLLGMCMPKELLAASIGAAVVLGALSAAFGGALVATLLGVIALVGLAVQAMGVALPRIVALGWWLLLVLYVVVSILVAIGGNS